MPGNEQNRRIAKNTLMLYFRLLFVMGVGLYTSRVVLNTLGVEDFGIYNVVGGIVALFGFLNSTLSQGTQRFLTFHLGRNDFDNLEKTFSAILIMHIILAIIILIIAETVGLWLLQYKINIPADRKNAAFWVYQFSIFASMVSIIQIPYNASIIAHERMNIYAYVSIVEVVFRLTIVYLLVVLDYDKLVCYAALVFFVNLIIISIYRIYCKKQYKECRFRIITDIALYKPMLVFSSWLVISLSVFSLSTQGINLLLNMFFGPVINAARAISLQVNNAILSFVTNFQTAINPSIVKLYAAENMESLYTLIIQNIKFSFCMMWLLALPFFLKIDIVLKYWLINVPEHTSLFCRLALVQSLIACMQRPISMTVNAIGKLKRICIIVSMIYISVLPVSYLLLKTEIPFYVPYIIFIIAYFFDFLYQIFFLYKYIKFPIKRLLKQTFIPIISIVICSLLIGLLINHYFKDGFVSLVLVAIVSVISVLVSVYFIALSKDMRQQIVNKLYKRQIA
jgi:O-antigen/teichoic acid export membrane protein